MAGDIKSERRATSNRNGGRDHPGIPGDFRRNQQAGRQGRGGSAAITPKQAALALIALALDSSGDAIAAAQDAQQVGDYRLRARDCTHTSDPNPRREHLDGLARATFLDFLVAEIEAARNADLDRAPTGWVISAHEVAQRVPERPVFCGLPRGETAIRQTIIPARLVRSLAALFPPCDPAPSDAGLPDRLIH